MKLPSSPGATNATACRVIKIDPTADRRWDDFVRASSDGTFYHLGAWIQVLRQTYGYRAFCLAAETVDGTVCGVLPLLLVQSPLAGTKLLSLPFSDVCGPLATHPEAAALLLRNATALRATTGARYLQIRSARDDLAAVEPSLTADRRYVDFQLALSSDPAEIWANPAMAKPRGHIRKATKSGVKVRVGHTDGDLSEFYKLHLKTAKKHGMPAQPFSYFQNFRSYLQQSCEVRLLIARHQGRPVAASLFVGHGNCLSYVYNASEAAALELRPNYLVIWDAIQWACQNGYRRLSFGKTSRYNDGLVSFKRGWGAEPVPIAYYYTPDVGGLTSSAYGETSRKYELMTTLWRALPATVTDIVGAFLYRHLT